MVNVMQSNGGNHGKPNTGFHYSNGTMNITENKNFNITNNNNNNINNNDNNNIKQHSSRKFSLPTGNSYGNHKIPLDRMSSVASSQYTTANSVLKLVSDEDQVDARTKTKTWIFYCKLKWCWIALVLLLIITIAVLATFFVLERRSNHFTDAFVKGTSLRPCFERKHARYIPNVRVEPEITNAIISSERYVREAFKSKRYSAYALNVNYMGHKIYSSQRNASQDTIFPLASVTKIFPVLMLHMLIANKTINSIDDDVSQYEPRFGYINPFSTKKITFRHLACMMSGLPREAPCLNYTLDNFCPVSNEEMFSRVRNFSLRAFPGQVPAYSNLGFGILGSVLEGIVNTSFTEWTMENIAKPLGLNDSGFDILARKKDFPESTVNGQKAVIVNWGWLTPTGGMYASAADLAKLGLLFTGNTSLYPVSNQEIQRTLKPEFVWPDGDAQGCPFEMKKLDATGNKDIDYFVYSKDGSVFGYGSKFSLIPELQLNVNVLTANDMATANHIWTHVLGSFATAFDKLLKRKGDTYVLPQNVEYYVGSYKLTSYWPLITKLCNITLENNVLFLNLEWMKAPLSITEDSYVLKTGNYDMFQDNHVCPMLGLGLLRMRFHFDAPQVSGNQKVASKFHVNDISFYGYVAFERVK